MQHFVWDQAKNEKLQIERGLRFEDIVWRIDSGFLLNITEHPDQDKYAGQSFYIVEVDDYVCIVPGMPSGDCIVLKTIIPSRKATRKYLGKEKRK